MFQLCRGGSTSPFYTRRGGSCSPFSTGGHVLHTLFPKPSDGGTWHPQCLCTASCFFACFQGGSTSPFSTGAHVLHRGLCSPNLDQGARRTRSVPALLLVAGSVVATFEVSGTEENTEAAVQKLIQAIRDGLSVTVDGTTYTTQEYIVVDGEDRWVPEVRNSASLRPSSHRTRKQVCTQFASKSFDVACNAV